MGLIIDTCLGHISLFGVGQTRLIINSKSKDVESFYFEGGKVRVYKGFGGYSNLLPNILGGLTSLPLLLNYSII